MKELTSGVELRQFKVDITLEMVAMVVAMAVAMAVDMAVAMVDMDLVMDMKETIVLASSVAHWDTMPTMKTMVSIQCITDHLWLSISLQISSIDLILSYTGRQLLYTKGQSSTIKRL